MRRRNFLSFICLAAFCAIVISLLMPAFQKVRNGVDSRIINCQKQIALAALNYVDAIDGSLPPGTVIDAKGTPMHGWMSQLLPYVECDNVYRQIRFELPWDAPENRPAFQQYVRVFTSSNVGEDRNEDGYALAQFAGNSHVLLQEIGLPVKAISDGTSQTTLLGEVAAGYMPWGHPINLRDPAAGIGKAVDQFGGPRNADYVLFAMLDGSVRRIKSNTSPRVLKAIATPAGGEKIDDSDW